MSDKTKPERRSKFTATVVVFLVCAALCGVSFLYRWRVEAKADALERPDLAFRASFTGLVVTLIAASALAVRWGMAGAACGAMAWARHATMSADRGCSAPYPHAAKVLPVRAARWLRGS